MDVVGYSKQVFPSIKNTFLNVAEKLQIDNISFIPISVLVGDNISSLSKIMKWYEDKTLMQYLESCKPRDVTNNVMRFSVQYVINAIEKEYAGKMLSGKIKVGDTVVIYPSNENAIVSKIIHNHNEVSEAFLGQNIFLYFAKEPTIYRGYLISELCNTPKHNNQIETIICWLNSEEYLQIGKEYFLRINAMETTCIVTDVLYKLDINSFEQYYDGNNVEVNEFAKVRVNTMDIIAFDLFNELAENGRGIIVDTKTNNTSAAFIIERSNKL